MYQTKITSQGTISIPIALRHKYNLKVGEIVTIEDTGKIVITKSSDFASLRLQNSVYLAKNSISYKSGAGFEAHVIEKYGQE